MKFDSTLIDNLGATVKSGPLLRTPLYLDHLYMSNCDL